MDDSIAIMEIKNILVHWRLEARLVRIQKNFSVLTTSVTPLETRKQLFTDSNNIVINVGKSFTKIKEIKAKNIKRKR